MKKLLLFISLLLIAAAFSCSHGAKDDKNEIQPYSTTDTNVIERKNDPFADSSNKSQPENNEKGVD